MKRQEEVEEEGMGEQADGMEEGGEEEEEEGGREAPRRTRTAFCIRSSPLA